MFLFKRKTKRLFFATYKIPVGGLIFEAVKDVTDVIKNTNQFTHTVRLIIPVSRVLTISQEGKIKAGEPTVPYFEFNKIGIELIKSGRKITYNAIYALSKIVL